MPVGKIYPMTNDAVKSSFRDCTRRAGVGSPVPVSFRFYSRAAPGIERRAPTWMRFAEFRLLIATMAGTD